MPSTGYPQPRPVLLRDLAIGGGSPTRIMAVINASPESFHAASVAVGRQAVRDAAERAAQEGADLLDIGAMSTAPYKETRISAEEEAARMAEAVAAAREASGLPITADTMRAAAGRAALDAGADAINDVSGLEADDALGRLAAERGVPLILMAREKPGAPPSPLDPVEHSLHRLGEALDRARACSVPPDRILLDPGIGFFRGQRVGWEQFDLLLLRNLARFADLGFPLLVGASRKSFLGKLLDRPSTEGRLAGSLAAAAWCAHQRVAVIRTHDVAATRDVVRLWAMLEGAE